MSDIVHRIWNKYLGVNTPAAELAKDASAEIESLRHELKHMTDEYHAALEAEQVRYQQLCTFEAAVRHVTEEGKTKRSFSTSEGWAMVHKDRLTDLEIAEEQLAASQAREQQLREAVIQNHEWHENYDEYGGYPESELAEVNEQALALPKYTTALEAMIAKSGEVMRERTHSAMLDLKPWDHRGEIIRALPAVTIDDLKD